MDILGITRTVSCLEKSKEFYENILKFRPKDIYGRWQSYEFQDGIFYAIGEESSGSTNEMAFCVNDVESLWEQIKDKVSVVNPLEKTAWGTYRFVIKDPDGHLLSFGEK